MVGPNITTRSRSIASGPGSMYSSVGGTLPPVPALAAAHGFNTLLFNSTFPDTSKIDLANTGNPGKDWYLRTAWGPFVFTGSPTDPSLISVSNGIMQISDYTGNGAYSLASACYNGAGGIVGNAFGPGGYFEIVWRADPALSTASMPIWPAVWMMPVRELTATASAPNEYIEIDLDERFGFGAGSSSWSSNLHDFVLSGGSYSNVANYDNLYMTFGSPSNTFNTEAVLWVPQSQNGGSNGFFGQVLNNGSLINVVNYSAGGTASPSPSPTNPSGCFSAFDADAYVMLLAAGHNANNQPVPIFVKSFRVWGRP